MSFGIKCIQCSNELSAPEGLSIGPKARLSYLALPEMRLSARLISPTLKEIMARTTFCHPVSRIEQFKGDGTKCHTPLPHYAARLAFDFGVLRVRLPAATVRRVRRYALQ